MIYGRSSGSAVMWAWVLTTAWQPQGCVTLRRCLPFLSPGSFLSKVGGKLLILWGCSED